MSDTDGAHNFLTWQIVTSLTILTRVNHAYISRRPEGTTLGLFLGTLSFATSCGEGKYLSQNCSRHPGLIPRMSLPTNPWSQCEQANVSRAASYSHNILHPMYLATMLCPRLPLPDIISPFSHRNENINSLASRFSFSRPFWDLCVPTSYTVLA